MKCPFIYMGTFYKLLKFMYRQSTDWVLLHLCFQSTDGSGCWAGTPGAAGAGSSQGCQADDQGVCCGEESQRCGDAAGPAGWGLGRPGTSAGHCVFRLSSNLWCVHDSHYGCVQSAWWRENECLHSAITICGLNIVTWIPLCTWTFCILNHSV